MKRALLFCTIFAAFVAGAVGCKSQSSGTSGPPPIPTSSFRAGLTYLAFGDDFTVGIGSSYCGVNLTTTPCTSTAALPGTSSSINPRGWTQLLAGYLTLPKYQPAAFIP